MHKKNLIVIFMTYNSQDIIKKTISAAKKLSNNIVILDSYSNDKTVKIAKALGCRVIKKKFVNYSKSRNYLIRTFNKKFDWQLHLDADECLDDKLILSIKNVLKNGRSNYSYIIKRIDYFLGQKLRFAGTNSWHLRLFKSYSTYCEHRSYDQHFVSKHKSIKLDGHIHDFNSASIDRWLLQHVKWANLESIKNKNKNILQGNLFKDPRNQKRFFKNFYYKIPLFWRCWLYFIYRYIVKLGLLDGRIGFLYCFYQSLFVRVLVDSYLILKNK
jgi:hypothetical protein